MHALQVIDKAYSRSTSQILMRPVGASFLPDRRRSKVVLPAPLAAILLVSKLDIGPFLRSCTSNQKSATARRKVELDIFESLRVVWEYVGEVLDNN